MARIIIAEDDPTTQRIAAKFCEKLGHTPFVSPDGRHAHQALCAANRFDLLVTDIMMPHMNGEELIQAVRSHDALGGLPIIIISAVVGIRDISHLLERGATFFLAKPLEKDSFAEYVNRCLPDS
jgi:CheY-like chemotaxis protein